MQLEATPGKHLPVSLDFFQIHTPNRTVMLRIVCYSRQCSRSYYYKGHTCTKFINVTAPVVGFSQLAAELPARYISRFRINVHA